jgi:hypothetical protein
MAMGPPFLNSLIKVHSHNSFFRSPKGKLVAVSNLKQRLDGALLQQLLFHLQQKEREERFNADVCDHLQVRSCTMNGTAQCELPYFCRKVPYRVPVRCLLSCSLLGLR